MAILHAKKHGWPLSPGKPRIQRPTDTPRKIEASTAACKVCLAPGQVETITPVGVRIFNSRRTILPWLLSYWTSQTGLVSLDRHQTVDPVGIADQLRGLGVGVQCIDGEDSALEQTVPVELPGRLSGRHPPGARCPYFCTSLPRHRGVHTVAFHRCPDTPKAPDQFGLGPFRNA